MSWLRLHRWGCIRSIRTPAFNLPQCSRRLLSTSCHRSWFWQWNRWHDIFATKDSIMILTLRVYQKHTLGFFNFGPNPYTSCTLYTNLLWNLFLSSSFHLFQVSVYSSWQLLCMLWREEKAWNNLWDVSSRKIQTVERESFQVHRVVTVSTPILDKALSEIKSSQF